MDNLREWFVPINRIFEKFKNSTLDYNDQEKRRIFLDRGGKVLFVAHLDTVQKPKYRKRKKNKIYASGTDDRLGCHIAYKLSKELKEDLLLCDNEEQAKSTAKYHDCKDYNWIVEFDREGEDVVTYDLDCTAFITELRNDFRIGFGSFSDICSLNTTACCVNIGIGYRNGHSTKSYIDSLVLSRQIDRFRKFYERNKDIKYTKDIKNTWWQNTHQLYGFEECEICGCLGEKFHNWCLCEDCFEQVLNHYFYGESSYTNTFTGTKK